MSTHGKVIKTFKSKSGKKVTLRHPKPDDVDVMLTYINELAREDPMVTLWKTVWTREDEEKVLTDVLSQMETGDKVFLTVEIEGTYAGSGELRRGKNKKRHVADIGLSLAAQFRGDGVGKQLLETLVTIAKKEGITLLTLSVFETNRGAIKLYETLGFVKMGTFPAAIKHRGTHVGEVHMYKVLA